MIHCGSTYAELNAIEHFTLCCRIDVWMNNAVFVTDFIAIIGDHMGHSSTITEGTQANTW